MSRHDHASADDPGRGDRGAGRLRPGPGRRPALRHQSRRPTARRGHNKPPPAGPPPIAAPKNDLSWHDCTSRVFADAGVPAAPGVQLDCANYDADLDPVNGGSGTLSIGVVRARSDQTPHDAGPLVFTTGSDLPSSTQLPVWLSRAGADVLRAHPSSPSTAAAWACRARSTAAISSTARRCAIRRNSSPATTRWPTCPTSRTPPPRTAPTRSRRARRPTTTRTPPPTSSGCATCGTCPRSRSSGSATAPRWRWPTPRRAPTRSPD